MRAAAGLGWSLAAEDEASLEFRTGWSTGAGYASLDPENHAALTVVLARGVDRERALAVFRSAWALAEDDWGAAPLRGGPGPWLRWRGPESTPRLRYAPRAGSGGAADVRLELLVTERYESREARDAEYLGEQPYSWSQARQGAATHGMYLPGEDTAEGWDDFERRLTATIRDLADEATLLRVAPLIVIIEEESADWSPELPTCFLRFAGGTLRIECPVEPEPHVTRALTAIGWQPPGMDVGEPPAGDGAASDGDENGEHCPNYFRTFPTTFPFPPESSKQAARIVVGGLRSRGADLKALTYRVLWKGNRVGVSLPKLGI